MVHVGGGFVAEYLSVDALDCDDNSEPAPAISQGCTETPFVAINTAGGTVIRPSLKQTRETQTVCRTRPSSVSPRSDARREATAASNLRAWSRSADAFPFVLLLVPGLALGWLRGVFTTDVALIFEGPDVEVGAWLNRVVIDGVGVASLGNARVVSASPLCLEDLGWDFVTNRPTTYISRPMLR